MQDLSHLSVGARYAVANNLSLNGFAGFSDSSAFGNQTRLGLSPSGEFGDRRLLTSHLRDREFEVIRSGLLGNF